MLPAPVTAGEKKNESAKSSKNTEGENTKQATSHVVENHSANISDEVAEDVDDEKDLIEITQSSSLPPETLI